MNEYRFENLLRRELSSEVFPSDKLNQTLKSKYEGEKIVRNHKKVFVAIIVAAALLLCSLTVTAVALTHDWGKYPAMLEGTESEVEAVLSEGSIIGESQTKDGVTFTVVGVLGDKNNCVVVLEVTSDRIDAAKVLSEEGMYTTNGNGLRDDTGSELIWEPSFPTFLGEYTDGISARTDYGKMIAVRENWRCLPALDPQSKPHTIYAYLQFSSLSEKSLKGRALTLNLSGLYWLERLDTEALTKLNNDGSGAVYAEPTFAFDYEFEYPEGSFDPETQEITQGEHWIAHGQIITEEQFQFTIPLDYQEQTLEINLQDDLQWINGNGPLKKLVVSPLFLSCEVEMSEETMELYRKQKDLMAEGRFDEVNEINLSSSPLAETRFGYSTVTNACAPIIHLLDGSVITSSEAAIPAERWIYTDTEGRYPDPIERLTVPFQKIISLEDIAYIEFNGKYISTDGRVTDKPPV